MEAQPADEPTREQIDQTPGLVVVEFGANWCGHCQALRPHLEKLLQMHPEVQHIRIEDGKGRRLGRTFGVKLWPTLVLMRNGQILEQLVRPEVDAVKQGLQALVNPAA